MNAAALTPSARRRCHPARRTNPGSAADFAAIRDWKDRSGGATGDGRRMGGEERQHRVVEFARHGVRKRMAALRQELGLGARNGACQLFREIGRRYRIVLRRHHQRRRTDATEIGRTIERQDRKSTRLNSSHPSISYAVFCLKKKKKKKLRAYKRANR